MNRGCLYTDLIKSQNEGMSIAEFYAENYTHSSLNVWQERIEKGEVELNGRLVTLNERVKAGDKLCWHRPPWEEGEVPQNYRIIYEDEAVIAVDKPAGLPVNPDGGFLENTLTAFLNKRYLGEQIVPAHRLNRGTSGIILYSRTQDARRDLARQFREKSAHKGEMRKVYLAKTAHISGRCVGDRFTITAPIGKVPHPRLGMVYAYSSEGKYAESQCEIVENTAEYAIVKINLITGRPHQIRIHLAYFGYPLLGDALFLKGGKPSPVALPGDCGYFLRSIELTFTHPATHKTITLTTTPFPDISL